MHAPRSGERVARPALRGSHARSTPGTICLRRPGRTWSTLTDRSAPIGALDVTSQQCRASMSGAEPTRERRGAVPTTTGSTLGRPRPGMAPAWALDRSGHLEWDQLRGSTSQTCVGPSVAGSTVSADGSRTSAAPGPTSAQPAQRAGVQQVAGCRRGRGVGAVSTTTQPAAGGTAPSARESSGLARTRGGEPMLTRSMLTPDGQAAAVSGDAPRGRRRRADDAPCPGWSVRDRTPRPPDSGQAMSGVGARVAGQAARAGRGEGRCR